MENKILVETSARHVHVDEATLAILFGADAKLTVKKELSQPGQFASEQKVDLVGPKIQLRVFQFLDHVVKQIKLKFLIQMLEHLVLRLH